jgi:hypothetical protein
MDWVPTHYAVQDSESVILYVRMRQHARVCSGVDLRKPALHII